MEENQEVSYKSFSNSLKKNQLSHAYLLIGNPGTPLLEVAKYLAKSIICDDPNPLACDNCLSCMSFDDGTYPDFFICDGSKGSILKANIVEIEQSFQKKAYGSKGIMIYILHLIENANVQSTNSILKFLEEPQENVYAFITTNNENSVLPTIVSRCQVMHLKLVNREKVIEEAASLGVVREDAELLSYFYNDADLIKSVISDEDESEFYYSAKEAFINLFTHLANNDKKEAIYYYQSVIVPMINTKESARFFIDILIQAFEDLINIQNQKPLLLKSYDTILTALASKLTHVEETLVDILKQRNLLNYNLNISLLLNHLILEITKGE